MGKWILGWFLCCVVGAGCQSGSTVSKVKLEAHQATVERDGLAHVRPVSELKITCAPPINWTTTEHPYKTALYSHEQWKSPSKATGVGVVYAHLPIPLPASALLWFAKQQYAKTDDGGKLLATWTDKFGRAWFEAENKKYHVKGYAAVKGTDAWIVYSGYRVWMPVNEEEIAVAERCQEMVMVAQDKVEVAGVRE